MSDNIVLDFTDFFIGKKKFKANPGRNKLNIITNFIMVT